MIHAPIADLTGDPNTGRTTYLQFALTALSYSGRLDRAAPMPGFPDYFTVENMANLSLQHRGTGWMAVLQFKSAPEGLPGFIETPSAHPFEDEEAALMAGIALVCEVATGSPELPFSKEAGDFVIPPG